MAKFTRRRLLGVTASSMALGSLAGCIGGPLTAEGDEKDATAEASFFVFGKFASAVAGETATAETLVPVGQHGHGWEPGPKIQGEVLDADLFVHGVEGFQPWADDVAANVRDDGGDTELLRVGENVDLLEMDGGDHEEDEHHDEDEHEGDHDEDEHDGTETDHEGDHDEEEHEEDHDEEEHEEDHDEDEEEHDHAGEDPHFWLDPIRAKRAVETVREGFVSADGANADAYEENAEEYASRLDDLHESFESALGSASNDVVLVAGHDAFGYLADRYGFEVVTLTGVSPDDTPTPKDIERAQHVVEEHDLDYVVADPLESQTAADQLVEETDAEEVLPLTSIPGRTEEWVENDWGYVEVMEEVNLPTLKRALGAE
ncbi:metal ABC transporter substrate-binding protein [Halorussus salilacus]|uniref:metal ABC transporter substrate-binding protein n=1 Tax=Halorussus salilacus TaxID=2953750 RepID=UPI00209D2FAF|nr:metal ABC transporter substrate-binding protein [Halorussus salilacus]USZ69253.1 metal ABC transporter substrate-binding protein [Halorussus salilacus]